MVRSREDLAFLWDMLDAAKGVQEFVAGKTFPDYLNERMLRAAVERYLELLGEAARRVSQDFQDAHPEIPWRRLIALGHVLAHEYGEIKQELIWRVATQHMPELLRNLEPLIPAPPETDN